MKRLIAAGLCASVLTGCATDGKTSKQEIGTGAGVVIGGLAGSLFGKGSGKIAGILAGAVIGGLIGNQIGGMLDEEDQKALQAQAQQALLTQPDNTQVSWASARSGATAVVVPENTRLETREVRVVRDANVAPSPSLDLIGAKYLTTTATEIRLAPSADATVATTLAKGSTVWAVGKVNGQPWIMIARNGKSIGYAPATSLAPAPKPTQAIATVQPAKTLTPAAKPAPAPQTAAAFDLDAAAPVRTPADLDALGPTEKADVVVASVACRDIRTTASAKGESATSTQTACKSPDGAWELN